MSQKWSSEQINVLIDAYKEEPCLYATNTPNYHNRNLRTAALNRVSNAVLRLRPTTPKECASKFHNLRNQFNIEHSKVKSSLKSGTGTDDVFLNITKNLSLAKLYVNIFRCIHRAFGTMKNSCFSNLT